VPLRIPRLSRAVAAISLAAVPLVALAMPAYAGTVQQHEWWLSTLHVTQAWRSGYGGGVTVAVLADGVDARQPDLAGSVITGPDFTKSNRKPTGPYFGTVGTGLASLIVGHGHGATKPSGWHEAGIYGIADRARILSVRVTLSPGDPLWSSGSISAAMPGAIAAGIRYAVSHHASVIDLPPDPGLPGLSNWGDAAAAAHGSAAERAAIAYAVRKDVVLVAPAGDNGQAGDAINYPAAYPGVISVGAFNKTFVKAPYSNRQPYVTLTAAGQGVVAASPAGYQTLDSTWAASAIVTGIAALLRSRFPDLSAAQVRQALASGTAYHRAGGRRHGSGYGTVDALRAIRAASTISPPHAELAVQGALARRRPAVPHIESQRSLITHELITDAEISAAALAVLLVPIGFYSSASRRRDRRVALAMAQRSAQVRSRQVTGGMLADPLLEFFGPQHASPLEPASQRTPVSTRYQPRPSLTGRSTLSARPALPAGPVPSAPSGPAASDPWGSAEPWPTTIDLPAAHARVSEPPWSDMPAGVGAPQWPGPTGGATMPPAASGAAQPGPPPLASEQASSQVVRALPVRKPRVEPVGDGAERAMSQFPGTGGPEDPAGSAAPAASAEGGPTVLHAPVTGAPPWEPAQQPTTALPWAAAPAPTASQSPGGPGRTRQAPPESLWADASPGTPAARSVFQPEPPKAAAPGPQSWDDLALGDPAQPDGQGQRSDSGAHPIYVWNPPAAGDSND
jgi:Subtilase family